jgi:hypothetical protein
VAISSFDPSVLLNYYNAKLPLGSSQVFSAPGVRTQAAAVPPWDLSVKKPSQQSQDVTARSKDPYFDPKDRSLLAKGDAPKNAASQLEALLNSTLSHSTAAADANPALATDNHKMFALYSALNRLDYIAKMANREGSSDAQRPGLNKDFQNGLAQIQSFLKSAQFANLAVLPGSKTSTAQSTATIAYAKTNYVTGAVVSDKAVSQPVAGVSSTDSFTISITKGGVTSDVDIDLANVPGSLSVDNIDTYVNQQLQAAGFSTRFSRVQTGGDIAKGTATWGISITNFPAEKVELSSAAATPSVYVAGAGGKTDNQQGKLIKLSDLTATPTSTFSATVTPDSGTSTAKATAVDADGNVYVVGNSTGSFSSEKNQGSQDVFLSKYDSSGNLQWTKLLGAANTASAYGVAVDPSSGGVVVAGSVTGDLKPSAIGSGTDSFVAKYDSEGNQSWLRQVAPSSNDQANTVAVDDDGNVYLGGQVNSSIGAGQTSAGGKDAYITKLNTKGALLYHRQFGTAGTDSTARTAIADDGNLLVASIQNGHAVLTKYGSADGTSPALWQIDLGDLQGGTIGGLASANGRVYLLGATANVALDAGGSATVARANSGGTDSFVFAADDAGASASADFVSYVGTGSSEQGGGIALAGNKLYVTGTTTGTFAGETRSAAGTHNLFVAQLNTNGSLDWTRQYGGIDGESQGFAIAADETGSSVLDALKLPRGHIETNQSNTIESQTTARAGDYFSLQIQGRTGTRTAKITLEKGETLRSLALKINGALLFDGKATALAVKGGQGLKIAVNPGVKVKLVAGTKDFDALAGLGLKPQELVNDSTADTSKTAADKTETSTGPKTIGLAIDAGLDLFNKTTAAHAAVVVQGAMAQIKQAYIALNAPPQAAAQPTGPVPTYLQNQLAGYQTALAWLNTVNGG